MPKKFPIELLDIRDEAVDPVAGYHVPTGRLSHSLARFRAGGQLHERLGERLMVPGRDE